MSAIQNEFIFRNRYFLITDFILFVGSAIVSFTLRLEQLPLNEIAPGLFCFLMISLVVKFSTFLSSGVYSRYWKNAGPSELLLIGYACLISGFLIFVLAFILTMLVSYDKIPLPRSVPVIDFLLTTFLITTTRFSLRAYHHIQTDRKHRAHAGDSTAKRGLIIGAGQTGVQVCDAIRNDSSTIQAVGFLDDDTGKVGTYLRGLKVLGNISQLVTVVQAYDINLVIIAIPSAPGKVIREIVQVCRGINVEHKIVPSLYELVTGKISVSALRPISIDDLLRRIPIELEITDIQRQLRGHCVMVTGAGGSIGSELSRQIAQCQPSRLLLLGRGENSLFTIENRLKNEFPGVPCETLLVDVQDLPHMEAQFERWRPNVVFHTAAHKHVPMLEANVGAAVINNVAGTQNVVELCDRFNVDRMVLLSTDKAVHPTSVMGMSKRVAEMIVMNAAQKHLGRFTVVRFGNVLGSRGSVVPIFQQQIAAGGPVTITSEKMSRFFMSVSEAVLLVLKASVLTQHGPLFVLNMGDPVSILDLARDLIKLSGLEPGRDMEIRETGIRPGEKLCEKLFWDSEIYFPVEKGAIFALQLSEEQSRLIASELPNKTRTMIEAVADGNDRYIRTLLREIAYVTANAPASTHVVESIHPTLNG